MIITTIKIKNLSNGAIAGLKVDEFWYDKDGNPVTGSQPFRWRKPLQPGEVIDVVLQVPTESGDEPESVQVRARQRHDQGDAAAEALNNAAHSVRNRRGNWDSPQAASCRVPYRSNPQHDSRQPDQTREPDPERKRVRHEQQRRRRDA